MSLLVKDKKSILLKSILKNLVIKSKSNLIKSINQKEKKFEISQIDHLIFNEASHIVAKFKDFLILEDTSEFLRKVFNLNETTLRLKKVCEFYEKYSKNFPNYVTFHESKYIYKNLQRKQKIINNINEDNDVEIDKSSFNYERDKYFKSQTMMSIGNESERTDQQSNLNISFENLIEIIANAEKNNKISEEKEISIRLKLSERNSMSIRTDLIKNLQNMNFEKETTIHLTDRPVIVEKNKISLNNKKNGTKITKNDNPLKKVETNIKYVSQKKNNYNKELSIKKSVINLNNSSSPKKPIEETPKTKKKIQQLNQFQDRHLTHLKLILSIKNFSQD